ncbi:MAG: hypothetical protein PWP23_3375 [Candidatus Sumerlaeota bacterium]|nr:hypothetical protein [Candidatus Sumerlaeota bacterium]
MKIPVAGLIATVLVAAGLALGAMAFWNTNGADSQPLVGLARNREPLNSWLLETMADYPTDGSLPGMTGAETQASMGTTQDLFYKGRRMIEGGPQRQSHCIGLMFEVYMKAYERAAGTADFDIPTIASNEDYYAFRRDWYGVDGNKRTLVRALTERDLGREIRSLDDALPGDFLQFWRHTGSGHSAVLLKVERNDAGKPSALIFWSVHQTTGVSQKREEIGSGPREIDPSQIYIVRAYAPD